MATPKIKLYRLPTGYSSANDNDIQAATNDQLLPVKLKNVMPNQAYTLVGVSYKNEQILIPTIHLDQDYLDSVDSIDVTNQIPCVMGTTITLPQSFTKNSIEHKIDKFLVCNKSQMCPRFYYVGLQDGVSVRKYFIYGQDYKYVQNINNYANETLDSQTLKFVFGYDETSNLWIIQKIGTQLETLIGQVLYVANLYKYQLQECNAHFNIVDQKSIYFLTKSSDCQAFQNPNQFIPFIGQSLPRHLKTKIYYNSDLIVSSSESSGSDSTYSSSYNVYLTQQNENFEITDDYKLTNINSSTDETSYNDIYGKTAVVQYYTIKRNLKYAQQLVDGQLVQDYYNQVNSDIIYGYYNSLDNKFYRFYNPINFQFTGEIDPKLKAIYVNKLNHYLYSPLNGFYRTDQQIGERVAIDCYYNNNDGNFYVDKMYSYLLSGSNIQYYTVLNNNFKWNFYVGFYPCHEDSVPLTTTLFSSYSQKLYNGTASSTKPNTLFLQYVKLTNAKNFSFSIDNSSQLKINISNYEKDLFEVIDSVVQSQRTQTQRYVYSFLGDRTEQAFKAASRGVITNHQRQLTNAPTLQWRGCRNNSFEYLADVAKGIFNFQTYMSSEQYVQSQRMDYFYCDYYYENSPTKIFVSDYQCWVSSHLRNNPDIFYGKKDYQGDDYIDANDNAIATGIVPNYISSGYTIQHRNGSVTFGAKTQDLNFVGGSQMNSGITTDPITGVVSGGIARANFAYYCGIQNVIDQKLDYDPSYAGGGYKYKAITDKKYPDSLNKRWVKRDNVSQFIGLSFTTKRNNANGILADYNLPDLQTKQLQSLTKFGFEIGEDQERGINQLKKIKKLYRIFTNQFSYPHTYKINNLNETIVAANDIRHSYVSNLTQLQLRQLHPTLKNINVNTYYSLGYGQSEFQHNDIQFKTLQNQLLDTISVDYCQVSVLPAIKVKAPIFTGSINTNDLYRFKIQKGQKYNYSDFKLYIKSYKCNTITEMRELNQNKKINGKYYIVLNNRNGYDDIGIYRYQNTQFVKKTINYSINASQSLTEQVCTFIQDISDCVTEITESVYNDKTKSYVNKQYLITKDLRYLSQLYNEIYFKFYKTSILFRSEIVYDETLQTSDGLMYQNKYEYDFSSSESSSSDSSYNQVLCGKEYLIPNGYKQLRNNTNNIVFSISNLAQTTYFNFKVLDIYYTQNDYNQTIVYLIKKNEDLQG